MSGGSMDYLYQKVLDARFHTDTHERKAFKEHLKKVAKALHDIEWVDSHDYGPGDENKAIRACLSEGIILEAAIHHAQVAVKYMQEEIEVAKKILNPNKDGVEGRKVGA